MELIFTVFFDEILALLGKVTRNSKTTRTQMIVDILVAFVAAVAVLVMDGWAIWNAISNYRKGNVQIAIAFASVVVISILLIGFVILFRILIKKKDKER